MRTLKTAVVGCGLFGENHVKAYGEHAQAECVAVFDVNRKRAKEVAKRYSLRSATSLEEIATDKSIRAVSVATPDFAHTDIVLRLLEAGKHILVEKPLTTCSDEARQIVAAARKAKRTVMVDFHNRWNPPFVALKARIDAGELGRPVMGYFRLSNPVSIPFGMLSWSGRSGPQWFLFPHIVDMARWLIGGQRAVRVHAAGQKKVLKRRGCDAYDAIQATVTFEDCFVTFETCWILPKSWPNLIDYQCNLVGTKSTAQVGATEQLLRVSTPQRFETPGTVGLFDGHGRLGGFVVMPIWHFVDSVLAGRDPMVPLEDGLAATEIIEAMVRSIEEQRIVEL
jgi:predicted dehydrogenase